LASVQTRLRPKDAVFRVVVLTAASLESRDSSSRAIITVQDVTGLKQIEEELKESHGQMSDIIDSLTDAPMQLTREAESLSGIGP